jgi:hypothetical protein
MAQYLFDSLQRPYPVARALGQKSLDKALNFLGDERNLGELGFRVQNGVEDVFLLGCVEGRSSEQQFIEQDSQGIEIDLIGMSRST